MRVDIYDAAPVEEAAPPWPVNRGPLTADPIEALRASQEERDRVAQRLYREIEASIEARAGLADRWKKNEELDAVKEGVTTLNVVEGMASYTVPLWAQKCDRMVTSLVSTMTSPSPMVQVLDDAQGGARAEDIEAGLGAMASRGGFKAAFRKCARVAFNTNNAICWVRSTSRLDAQGQPERIGGTPVVSGVEFVPLHPRDCAFYPSSVPIAEASTAGHRDWTTVGKAKAKQDRGEWFVVPLEADGDPSLEGETDSARQVGDQLEKETTVEPEDGAVELWHVVTAVSGRRVLLTLAYRTQKLLEVQEWPYPENGYADLRTLDHDGGAWSENSHAQRVQGLGFAYSDMANTIIQGSYLQAFPILVQTGPGFSSKLEGYKPGQLKQGPEGMKITPIPIPFNPGAMGDMMQEIKSAVDALTGISPVGTSEGMPRPTTATEIEALVQAQAESKGAHSEFAAPFSAPAIFTTTTGAQHRPR